MTQYTTIPAGYRISVTSWENDADNYRTECLEGLSKEVVSFYVDFSKLFTSKNNRSDKGFGNLYEPNDSERQALTNAFTKVVEKHKDTFLALCKDWNYDETPTDEEYQDICYELHHELFGGSEYFYTRVLDSYKVEYTPTEVRLEDVTYQF